MVQNLSQTEIVEVIFTKLSLIYGREFLARWEGLDLADVKNDWAYELENVPITAIRHALKNLPSTKAPTVLEFRNIARNAPQPEFVRIEQPTANSDIAQREIAKARAILKGAAA
jgi:hypothetical protein